MTDFEMCTLLMLVVCDKITDKHTCLRDSVPTDPKKLVKELTNIGPKLWSNKTSTDLRKGGQVEPPSDTQSPNKDKGHKKGGVMGVSAPIPRTKDPLRDTVILCALCHYISSEFFSS